MLHSYTTNLDGQSLTFTPFTPHINHTTPLLLLTTCLTTRIMALFNQNDIVHRDLKLENIVLDGNGNIKVSVNCIQNNVKYIKVMSNIKIHSNTVKYIENNVNDQNTDIFYIEHQYYKILMFNLFKGILNFNPTPITTT